LKKKNLHLEQSVKNGRRLPDKILVIAALKALIIATIYVTNYYKKKQN